MKEIVKKLLPYLPRFVRRFLFAVYEWRGAQITKKILISEDKELINFSFPTPSLTTKKRVFFYHVSGLSFGGTEKLLQIIAKHLNKQLYDVTYIYSAKPRSSSGNIPLDGRKPYLEHSDINLVEFHYQSIDQTYPFTVRSVTPTLSSILKDAKPDIFITAGSGYSEYPFNTFKNIPIIMFNIFGSPTVQKNIVKQICISHAVANKIKPIVPLSDIGVMYIPSEGPTEGSLEAGNALRKHLGILETDIVFGRIGRADDSIFDPIGIRAFQKIVQEHPNAHYIIMSPPPILKKIVTDEHIPNVHFLSPSSKEEEVWAFQQAIDVLAHFRLDGESCGLNIIESMLCAKPIISHKSHQWNAHLEYLDQSFSRIAEIDNIDQYASYMKEMIEKKNEGTLLSLGLKAKEKAEPLFLIAPNIQRFQNIIDKVLS